MKPVKNNVITKKKARGRPRKADAIRTVLSVALSVADTERLAEWMADNGIESRSEAGRVLLVRALDAEIIKKRHARKK